MAAGTDCGKEWRVIISRWRALQTLREAREEVAEMKDSGIPPSHVPSADTLVGNSWLFTQLKVGDAAPQTVAGDSVGRKAESFSTRQTSVAQLAGPPTPSPMSS